jgi:hypothetical protein
MDFVVSLVRLYWIDSKRFFLIISVLEFTNCYCLHPFSFFISLKLSNPLKSFGFLHTRIF